MLRGPLLVAPSGSKSSPRLLCVVARSARISSAEASGQRAAAVWSRPAQALLRRSRLAALLQHLAQIVAAQRQAAQVLEFRGLRLREPLQNRPSLPIGLLGVGLRTKLIGQVADLAVGQRQIGLQGGIVPPLRGRTRDSRAASRRAALAALLLHQAIRWPAAH